MSHSAQVTNLTKTYSLASAVKIYGEGAGQLDVQPEEGPSIALKIFLAIERGDLVQRLYRYVFAELHTKHTPVSAIVREVEDALPDAKNTKTKIYHYLHLGSRWHEILEQFASVVGKTQGLFGLLCLLGSLSS